MSPSRSRCCAPASVGDSRFFDGFPRREHPRIEHRCGTYGSDQASRDYEMASNDSSNFLRHPPSANPTTTANDIVCPTCNAERMRCTCARNAPPGRRLDQRTIPTMPANRANPYGRNDEEAVQHGLRMLSVSDPEELSENELLSSSLEEEILFHFDYVHALRQTRGETQELNPTKISAGRGWPSFFLQQQGSLPGPRQTVMQLITSNGK